MFWFADCFNVFMGIMVILAHGSSIEEDGVVRNYWIVVDKFQKDVTGAEQRSPLLWLLVFPLRPYLINLKSTSLGFADN